MKMGGIIMHRRFCALKRQNCDAKRTCCKIICREDFNISPKVLDLCRLEIRYRCLRDYKGQGQSQTYLIHYGIHIPYNT